MSTGTGHRKPRWTFRSFVMYVPILTTLMALILLSASVWLRVQGNSTRLHVLSTGPGHIFQEYNYSRKSPLKEAYTSDLQFMCPIEDPMPDIDQANCDFKARFYGDEKRFQTIGDQIIKKRANYLRTWYDKGCQHWDLDGVWAKRDRKIYYTFLLGGEMELLSIVLEEIYPVVDYIVIVECTQTWRGDRKPLFFPSRNSTFRKYMDKIHYFTYGFHQLEMGDRIKDCMEKDMVGSYRKGPEQCRWMRQWSARDYLAKMANEIEKGGLKERDVLVMADLDELLAREFLKAVKHCDVWPEHQEGKCARVGVETFPHRYYFGCTIAKSFGHPHPDMVIGRCLDVFGGEEIRRNFGDRKVYKPKPNNLVKTKIVGPGGWHMHSFLSSTQVFWKQFSRAGPGRDVWTKNDTKQIEMINRRRESCRDGDQFFTMNARACQPIPHLIKDNPKVWKHYLEYVDDGELPDYFNTEPHFRKTLLDKLNS
ncbi:hypothetical protein AAMO2058_001380200 [Amorphochlora amoebiformis]